LYALSIGVGMDHCERGPSLLRERNVKNTWKRIAALEIELTVGDLSRIESVSPKNVAYGGRMDDISMKGVNL
jgi:hypothetical protein